MKILQKTGLTLALMLVAATAFAEPQIYKLQVDGLACPFCAFGIEKKLSEIKGVDQLDTDIKASVIRLTMKDGVLLDETVAEQAVEKAGFTLRGFEQIQTQSRHKIQ